MTVPTVVYVNNGTARLLRLDEGEAHELARVDVADMREAEVLTLMLNIATSFNGARVRTPQPGRAEADDAPRQRGIMASVPARAPAVEKRQSRPRRSRAETVRLVRAAVARSPGIARADLLRQLGYANASGAAWSQILVDAGVRIERGGARGRGASVRYFLPES